MKKLKDGIEKIKNKEDLPHTYFVNDAKKLISRALPLFLEGSVHLLKIIKDKRKPCHFIRISKKVNFMTGNWVCIN